MTMKIMVATIKAFAIFEVAQGLRRKGKTHFQLIDSILGLMINARLGQTVLPGLKRGFREP